jgi:hypothetical protein
MNVIPKTTTNLAEVRVTSFCSDCLEVLTDITDAALLPLAGLAGDSARALRARHCAASQALSANIFDTWLRDVLGRGTLFTPLPPRASPYKHALRQIARVDGNSRMIDIKRSGSLTPVVMALASFTPGDPTPEQFGRHATACGRP